MSIYDKAVRVLIREMVGVLAPEQGHIFSKDAAIAWFAEHYPKIKEGTITAHLIRFSINARSRVHYSARPDEDLLYQVNGSHFRLYDPSNDPAPIHSKSDTVAETRIDSEEQQTPSEFAYESDLRDFLAKNLSIIEPGLQLYQDEGINGIEFPVGGRFIDILAVDEQKALVVIELKVSKGYDRVIGQILRYMAWIEKHHAEPGQRVRGIIAAREISNDLRLACSYLPAVHLYEYQMSVVLRKVILETRNSQ
ncbi:MAG: endonuclease NucS domain-containing protein [Pyrinomonadaceae bacterium]